MGCCNNQSTCIREHISAAMIRPLRYIRGIDAEGCVSYADATTSLVNVGDTNTIDLSLSGGVITGQVRISAQTNNILTALSDGLFVPRAPVQSVTNTDTVTLTLTPAGVLSATVNVSSNPGNQIQVLPNGLFVPAPPAAFITGVANTNTVTHTVAGGILTSNVVVSPAPGNQIQVTPQGLFVPPSAAGITVQDTNTVDLTLSSGVLSANAIVSSAPGNQIQVTPQGLFVPPSAAGITVQDTNTVDLTLSGGVLSADAIVSPAPGNQIQVTPQGLFVPPSAAGISVQDTSTVDLTLNAGTLTADVVVAPNNALQATPNGLSVDLRDCQGNVLPAAARLVSCVSANPVGLPIGVPFIGVAPNTAYQVNQVSCTTSATHDVIVQAGVISARQRDNSPKYLGLLATMPNILINGITINAPAQTIDTVSITNPSQCRWMLVMVRMFNTAVYISLNDSGLGVFARSTISVLDTLLGVSVVNAVSQVIVANNMPPWPNVNTPITSDNWYFNYETGAKFGFSMIPPGATHTFTRRVSADTSSSNSQRAYARAGCAVEFYGFLFAEY